MRSKVLPESVLGAWEYAKLAHRGAKDDMDKDYFSAHVAHVVDILLHVTDDEILLKAACLHDTIEDTETTYDEVVELFGKPVADLVMEVTHEGTKKDGYYFPRLSSHRGYLLKFADRLSNISRMDAWDNGRKEHYLARSRFWKSVGSEKPNPILVPINLGDE